MISAEERGQLDQNPQINEFHPEPIIRSARINVTNESMQPVSGEVRWALRTPDGSVVRSGAETITVPALSAHWLQELVFDEASLNDHYLSFAFVSGGETVSEGTALFCAPKHFNFADPALTVRREGDEIVVTSGAYAKFVAIESDDADLLLSDNFFDLNPGEKRVKVLRGSTEGLKVRSVYDLD
jgi:beta-mannosidase